MSINVSEVIWTIVCFFALLFVLKKFLFDPLLRFMEQRQAALTRALKGAGMLSGKRTKMTPRSVKNGGSAA